MIQKKKLIEKEINIEKDSEERVRSRRKKKVMDGSDDELSIDETIIRNLKNQIKKPQRRYIPY